MVGSQAQSVPLLLDDLAEAVKHAIVFGGGSGASLQLTVRLVSNLFVLSKGAGKAGHTLES
jgi:hypothetical protein